MKKKITKKRLTSNDVRLKAYARFKRSRTNFYGSFNRRLISILFLVSFSCGIFYLCYDIKAKGFTVMNAYFIKIKQKLALSKPTLNPIKNKQKPLTQVTENINRHEAPIHFEFYDTLPTMQITIPKPKETPKPKEAVLKTPVNDKIAKPAQANPGFIRAEELERALSLEIKQRGHKIKTKMK